MLRCVERELAIGAFAQREHALRRRRDDVEHATEYSRFPLNLSPLARADRLQQELYQIFHEFVLARLERGLHHFLGRRPSDVFALELIDDENVTRRDAHALRLERAVTQHARLARVLEERLPSRVVRLPSDAHDDVEIIRKLGE